MILCEKKKLDDKCRLQIPTKFIKESGGKPGGIVYVLFDEETGEIKLTAKKEENNENCH